MDSTDDQQQPMRDGNAAPVSKSPDTNANTQSQDTQQLSGDSDQIQPGQLAATPGNVPSDGLTTGTVFMPNDSAASVSSETPTTTSPPAAPAAVPVYTANNGPLLAAPPNNGLPKTKKPILKIGLIAAIFGIFAIVGIVFGWYLPNQPANVWKTGLTRTGAVLDDLVIAATEQDKLDTIKSSEATGTLEFSSEGYKVSGSINSKYDAKNSDNALDVALKVDGEPDRNLNLDLLTSLPDGKDFPDIYVRLTGIKQLGLDSFFPAAGDYENKWIAISSDYLQSLVPVGETPNQQQAQLTSEDAAELARTVSRVTREYVFTADDDKAILVQKSFVGTEELDNDITANHYTVGFNKENIKKYCQNLVESVVSLDAYKRVPGVNPDTIDQDKKTALTSCEDDIVKDIEDEATFDMWVDKKTKLIHKIRVADKNDSNEYYELGQTYKGGDVIPIFLSYHSQRDAIDAKFTLQVDSKQNITKGDFSFEQKQNGNSNAKATFEFKPFSGPVNIEKPAGAVPLEQLLQQLGLGGDGGLGSAGTNTQAPISTRAKDVERETDIKAMHAQTEAYYAQNGSYPTLAQFNNVQWRATNMRGLDQEALKDPEGTATTLALQPIKSKQYGYNPTQCSPDGCQAYVLSAILSDDTIYRKANLN